MHRCISDILHPFHQHQTPRTLGSLLLALLLHLAHVALTLQLFGLFKFLFRHGGTFGAFLCCFFVFGFGLGLNLAVLLLFLPELLCKGCVGLDTRLGEFTHNLGLDEVWLGQEIGNVESYLCPSVDCRFILGSGWLGDAEDDLARALLGTEGAAHRTLGRLVSDDKVLEDLGRGRLGEEFGDTDVVGLEEEIGDIVVLGEQRVRDGHGCVLEQPGEGLYQYW